MLPLLLGVAARAAGSAVARGAATELGASAASAGTAGRYGAFVGGALANRATQDRQPVAVDNEPRRNPTTVSL